MKITEKLKALREEKSLTQRQIAADLDMDVAVYNRFEKGERQMKRDMILKIANYYHVSATELIKCWLAERVYSILEDEKLAGDVIGMVAEEIAGYGKKTGNA